ncbi:unnamed protein product [Durusdinium trenchii]|uniref:Uncharacterized protein n=1 Tax=Durusdinium trenchii TaxID=1381693 RepID=A0ABP0P2A1_9DINO
MATIEFGAEQHCLTFEDLDMPLWQLLCVDEVTFMDFKALNDENQNKALFVVVQWFDRRYELKDIAKLDPSMEADLPRFIAGRKEHAACIEKIEEHREQLEVYKVKVRASAEAMFQQQKAKLGQIDPNWDSSELGKANQKAVDDWATGKIEVMEKAQVVLADGEVRAGEALEQFAREMFGKAYQAFKGHLKDAGKVEALVEKSPMEDLVDPGFLQELQPLCIDTLPSPASAKKKALGNRCEHLEKEHPGETPEEKDARLAEWLSSGQNWMNSSIVANASRSKQQKKRGTYIMMEYKALKAKYGTALAKQIRDEKKDFEEKKEPGDECVYWMRHPDCGEQTEAGEYDLVRVFDSMTFEDETTDRMEIGIEGHGNLDAQQSREVMQIAMGNHMQQFNSNVPVILPGDGTRSVEGTLPPPPPPNKKRVVPLTKQLQSKISASSAKLTECMAWESKITDCTTLSQTLLAGFKNELDISRKAISEVKRQLETTYAKTLGKDEKKIQEDPALSKEISDHLGAAEAAFTSFTGTYKSIKASIDT